MGDHEAPPRGRRANPAGCAGAPRGCIDGLTGEQILLGARIAAVCDAFDAIISNRPYATARTCAEATTELCRCAGSHFDADVVAAFVAVLAQRARLPDGVAAS